MSEGKTAVRLLSLSAYLPERKGDPYRIHGTWEVTAESAPEAIKVVEDLIGERKQ